MFGLNKKNNTVCKAVLANNGSAIGTVSWEEFKRLQDRFEALCEHLGVTVWQPYRMQVTKKGEKPSQEILG
jgi:hypothetical protein